jgi:hypothetical protein
MMSTVWLASNSAPADQIAAIQRQRIPGRLVWLVVMAVTLRQRVTGAKSLMQ